MPIRPELRHLYRGPKWEAVRARILARAGNRCEQCGKRNHRRVWVFNPGQGAVAQCWSSVKGDGQRWRACGLGGTITRFKLRGQEWEQARRIRVILTLAHLNHVPGDDRDENLKALCQWCHLHYDQLHHKATRSIRKDAGRPLLQERAS